VTTAELASLTLQVDTRQVSRRWDKILQDVAFTCGKGLDAGEDVGERIPHEEVPPDKNPWQDETFLNHKKLPKPDRDEINIRQILQRFGLDFLFTDEALWEARFAALFHENWVARHLDRLYRTPISEI